MVGLPKVHVTNICLCNAFGTTVATIFTSIEKLKNSSTSNRTIVTTNIPLLVRQDMYPKTSHFVFFFFFFFLTGNSRKNY